MSSNGSATGRAAASRSRPPSGSTSPASFSALYDSTSFRDAFLADTPCRSLFSLTGDRALSTGNAGYQFVLPHTRLEGEPPNSNEGDEIGCPLVQGVPRHHHRAGVVVARTADAAL